MRNFAPRTTHLFLSLALTFSASVFALDAGNEMGKQVLVTIDNLTVTDKALEEALRSSPFYTQFNAMTEKQQGALRGNILKRLVTSRLLSLEAKKSGVEESAEFKKEMDNFRKGLLYRFYMDSLKNKIEIPQDQLEAMQKEHKDNRDAFKAAKASYITDQYSGLYQLTIKSLRDKYHVVLHEDLVSADAKPETVILEGDGGIEIKMADVLPELKKGDKAPHKDQLLETVYQLAELLVVAKAGEDEGVEVTAQVDGFKKERLPAMFLENKQDEWAADETVLKSYFDAHPEASFIPQRWHLGMIVLKTEDEANKVLKRIHKGESLFKLAGELSIDPYGKEHRGDMGWVRERTGNPVIENAIKNLDDGKISDVIKIEKGFLIATILDRRPGGKRRFESMKDKVRQLVINERMHDYLAELQKKHKVTWNILNQKAEKES